jgi:hypothetical protein
MMHGDPEDPAAPHARTEILFCPYCRDGFERLSVCPEHELSLVPIDRLPRMNRSTRAASTFVDPRFGRGPVLLGAALTIIGFFMPFARTQSLEASALEVAIDGAHNLWLAPGAAIATLAVLWVRRDRDAMWSARLAVLGLAVAGLLPIVYTGRRIRLMAEAAGTDVDWLTGGVVMVLGLMVVAVGSLRFGIPSRR